jgi:hypothetical protein
MSFKKAGLILSVAGTLTFASISISHAAGFTHSSQSVSSGQASVTKHDRLLKAAKKFNIDSTGKTDTELKAEIKQAALTKLTDKAQKLGITTTDMTPRQLKKEIRSYIQKKETNKLKKEAAKLNLSIDGKTNKELRESNKAALHQKLVNKAHKLNLNVTNSMTNQQLREAIKAKREALKTSANQL